MDDMLTIAVLAGTSREHRKSIHAAHYIADIGKTLPNTEIIFVDPRDFNLPNDGNKPEGKDPRYTDITTRADAFFIVTPEYNHSIPGSLKRMLDSEYETYKHKPVALAGASDGPWGGTRVCEALLSPLHTMGMVIVQPTVYFPFVQNIFNEDGTIAPDYVEQYKKSIGGAYRELVWFGRMLKQARADTKAEA